MTDSDGTPDRQRMPGSVHEIVRLARPDIVAMAPYSLARIEGDQHVEILLDANENPLEPSTTLHGEAT